MNASELGTRPAKVLATMSPSGKCDGRHLQQVGEFGVAVGDVGRLGGEGAKDVAERAEALVDGARLLLPLPRHLAPAQPLAAWQQVNSMVSETGSWAWRYAVQRLHDHGR